MHEISSLIDRQAWLKEYMPRYSRWHTLGMLSGLLTSPGCYANTVRIEALAHMAMGVCRGERIPTRDELIIWANVHLSGSGLAHLEDPLEDVFVSNVVTASGDRRIFQGLWESNDFWLQSLLRVLPRLPGNAAYLAMMRNIEALLALSEKIAERNGLIRNTAGSGDPAGRIRIPQHEQLQALSRNVVFSDRDLTALGITSEDLKPFVWSDAAEAQLLAGTVENSPLEQRPLLAQGTDYLVCLPAVLGLTVKRLVLDVVASQRDLIRLDGLLNEEQGSVSQDALSRLEGRPWNPPNFPRLSSHGVASLAFIPFRFDCDKFGMLLMIQPRLPGAHKHGFARFDDLTDRWKPVEAELQNLVRVLSETDGFRSGLFIMVVGGLGIPVILPKLDLAASWSVLVYSVPNFLTLAGSEEVDFLMIWRLARQQRRAADRGIRFMNPNGDFNLIAAWRNMDYVLMPPDVPADEPGLVLVPPTDALFDLRRATRDALDIHSAPRGNLRRWYEVERASGYAWFAHIRRLPFFVSRDVSKELCGVVEALGVWLWVTCSDRPKSSQTSSIIYQVWDCFGHWLAPVAQRLSARFAPADAVGEFRLVFPKFSEWSDSAAVLPDEKQVSLQCTVNDGLAVLDITETFFRSFMQPQNKAEREIVQALLVAGAGLLGRSFDPGEVESLRDSVIPLGEARYFHVLPGKDVSYVAYRGPADAYSVRPEVLAEVTQDLGFHLAPAHLGKNVEDPEEVRRLVRGAVAHLKQAIAVQLKDLSLTDVVSRCLVVLDLVHREQYRWRISAAALTSMNPDQQELAEEAHKRDQHRAGANVSARILIETALFSCPQTGGSGVSDSDLDELLAKTQTLVRLADYDLAKRAGFPAGRVVVSRSGELEAENSFLDQIRSEYARATFREGYAASASSYHKLFARGSSKALPQDFAAFTAAMVAEIGVTPEQSVQVADALHALGIAEGKPQLIVKRAELAKYLVSRTDATLPAIEKMLMAMRIYPRTAWNKDLPPGCTKADVLPWRFKRRYSLLRRPLIELSLDPDPEVLVSPLLVGHGLRHFVNNAYEGEFPADFFTSERMQTFQQSAVDRRSKQFVDRVAAIMKEAEYSAVPEVQMEKLGAPPELGDIDVLAWRKTPAPEVWILECKALRNARSTSEILSQLDAFKGESGDLLAKHQVRMLWLAANPSALADYTGLVKFDLSGLIISSHQVPMQFLPDGKNSVFADVPMLRSRLKYNEEKSS